MEIMIYILVFLFAIFIQYIVIKNAINDSILKDILYEIRKKSQTKSPPKPTTDNKTTETKAIEKCTTYNN